MEAEDFFISPLFDSREINRREIGRTIQRLKLLPAFLLIQLTLSQMRWNQCILVSRYLYAIFSYLGPRSLDLQRNLLGKRL